jgi:hypothetical protein
MNKIDEFIEHIQITFTERKFIKITIGNLREKKSYLKNIFIKPVVIKEEDLLSFIYRYVDKDVTKNFPLSESITTIKKSLKDFFYNAELYTNTENIYYTQDAKTNKEKLVVKVLEKEIVPKIISHDKQKNRLLNTNAVYLKELGITSTEGNIKAAMQHKFKQINRYVEIIDGIIKETPLHKKFSVADMGSGKGYLTFALYDFLQQKNVDVKITGIELREDLVTKCNNIAALSKFDGLSFIKGSIQEIHSTDIDMLIALHACDTATDDAIAKGIKAAATFIICAPCCHKQIRKQMAPSNALQYITKHGILLERQAEMVTDTIRALILEAHGYKTKVFDFIEEEDTPKNVLIVGRFSSYSQNIFEENMKKVNELKAMFGIKEHYLETVII